MSSHGNARYANRPVTIALSPIEQSEHLKYKTSAHDENIGNIVQFTASLVFRLPESVEWILQYYAGNAVIFEQWLSHELTTTPEELTIKRKLSN